MTAPPDLDRLIPRAGTGSVKWEYREGAVGHGSTLVPAEDPDVIPMWVADMDFPCPEVVIQAIRRRAEHPIFGYSVGLPEPAGSLLRLVGGPARVPSGPRLGRSHRGNRPRPGSAGAHLPRAGAGGHPPPARLLPVLRSGPEQRRPDASLPAPPRG